MPIKLVDSPVNRMKLQPPTSNAPSLRKTNPPSAQPNVQGAQAPLRSAPIDLPVAK
jgi:hypothetical protein